MTNNNSLGDNSKFTTIITSRHGPSFNMSALGIVARQPVIVKRDSQADTSFLSAHLAARAGVCIDGVDKSLAATVADERIECLRQLSLPF